ncbi:hypothetical protein DFR86_01315 [Acidianus sulfidivorans JP7]|uniref:Uncharacterized protein n=1 Tax=Acidianus sulfidivorans JP7 TaxID=619593 RepID=A0A2U9IK03_9CREN|nr:hypothetical protein [Acidianus sulfidivorans]AWR96315.1 hypothetical protein DFR86_01315 [Acidianus sulfidivorans JP7]
MSSRSVLDIYNSIANKFSKNQYTPALAAAELASLIITYVAGMGIAIFKLPLSGAPITAHIYAAAFDVIFAIALYGSSTRAGNLPLRILSVLDILTVLGGAFMGLFYFGGFSTPTYALGMGTGFVLTIVFTSAILFYSLRR